MAHQVHKDKTKTETTSVGEQHVIPGAEKISYAELAKRKAEAPLKSRRSDRSRLMKACSAIGQTRLICSTSPAGQRPPSLEFGCHVASIVHVLDGVEHTGGVDR